MNFEWKRLIGYPCSISIETTGRFETPHILSKIHVLGIYDCKRRMPTFITQVTILTGVLLGIVLCGQILGEKKYN